MALMFNDLMDDDVRKARTLRRLKVTEISSVDRAANPGARVMIAKRDGGTEEISMPELLDRVMKSGGGDEVSRAEAIMRFFGHADTEEVVRKQEDVPMDLKKAYVEKVLKTLDAASITRLADEELEKGASCFSQSDRQKMWEAVLAPGSYPGPARDVLVAKGFKHPSGIRFLKWSLLPVADEHAADAFEADHAALGKRVDKGGAIGPPGPLASLQPLQVGGIDAFRTGGSPRGGNSRTDQPTEADRLRDQIVRDQQVARPWMSTAQLEAYADNMTAAVEQANGRLPRSGREYEKRM